MTEKRTFMKNILITGASRGIGRAAAMLCGARGWGVAINYLQDRVAAEDAVRVLEVAGGKAVTSKGDVTVETDVIASVRRGRVQAWAP